METLKYIDLFAGCGGLSLGMREAGWKGVFAIEKCRHAFATLNHNLVANGHFNWPSWMPIQQMDINSVIQGYENELRALRGSIDLVAGGPPCQGFSTAGLRKEGDERNQLIDSYVKFIRLVQPKLIFFENVRGFTTRFKQNRTKGRAYSEYVKEALRQAAPDYSGYRVYGEIVNFEEFGVPQKRARFILVGVREDLPRLSQRAFFENIKASRKKFLISKGLHPEVPVSLESAISDLLRSNGTENSPDTEGFQAGKYGSISSSFQRLCRGEIAKGTIADSHRFPNHRIKTIARFEDILTNAESKNRNLDEGFREKYQIKKHTIIPLAARSPSPTLTTLPDDYIHYREPRILTVREYARIQTFPDWYEFKGKYTTGGKMRTKEVPRYSQIGNAIPPLFGEQSGLILKQMLTN